MADKRGKFIYPLPEEVYISLAEKLYSPLLLGENSVLLCPPLHGRDHNIFHIWNREEDRISILGIQRERFVFGLVQLANLEKNAENCWLEQMERSLDLSRGEEVDFAKFSKTLKELITEGKEPTFLINIPETLTDELFVRFLALIKKIYYLASSRIHFLLVFDMKWDDDDFIKLVAPFNSLFQNVIQVGQYSKEEIEYFVKYWCYQWHWKLSYKTVENIVIQSGGILLLAKAIVRLLIKKKLKSVVDLKKIINDSEFQIQVKFLLSRFTDTQQQVLHQIANNQNFTGINTAKVLQQMNIVSRTITGWKINSQVLSEYLKEEVYKIENQIQVINESEILSKREKLILNTMIKKTGELITRDQIADIIWEEKKVDRYSDWAIDQTISRIRKKIMNIPKLHNLLIKTIKKQGFLIN